MSAGEIIAAILATGTAGWLTLWFIVSAAEAEHLRAIRSRFDEIEARRDQSPWGEVVRFPREYRAARESFARGEVASEQGGRPVTDDSIARHRKEQF